VGPLLSQILWKSALPNPSLDKHYTKHEIRDARVVPGSFVYQGEGTCMWQP
jgi:hypothetical protein